VPSLQGVTKRRRLSKGTAHDEPRLTTITSLLRHPSPTCLHTHDIRHRRARKFRFRSLSLYWIPSPSPTSCRGFSWAARVCRVPSLFLFVCLLRVRLIGNTHLVTARLFAHSTFLLSLYVRRRLVVCGASALLECPGILRDSSAGIQRYIHRVGGWPWGGIPFGFGVPIFWPVDRMIK